VSVLAVPPIGRTPHIREALDPSCWPLHGGGARSSIPCTVELRQCVFFPPLFSFFSLKKYVALAKKN